jgi:hypothetical protein
MPDTAETIPVSVTIPAAGDYAINCTDLKEMDKYEVTLKDNSNQQITDLNKIKSYSFHADAAGAVDDRFVINISKIHKVGPVVPVDPIGPVVPVDTVGTDVPVVTVVDKPVLNEQQFNIYSSQGIINVVPLQDAWNGEKAEIKIINITGTTMAVRTNIEFSKGSPETFILHLQTGIYFVSVSTSTKKFVGKINIVK